MSAFDEEVKINYQSVLNRMIGFVNDFIDLGEAVHKDAWLVRALIDLIRQDQSIDANAEFYMGRNGEKIKKATLGDLSVVCLPSFLLGVWHYVVINRRDNKIGRKTYDKWCPSAGGGERHYTAHMGKDVLTELKVYMIGVDTAVEAEVFDENYKNEHDDFDAKEDNVQTSQQIVNDNPTFFNFNITGNNNSVFNHVDKVIVGGKKDE